MPNVEGVIKSLKLSWFSRLINDTIPGRWKTLCLKLINATMEDITSKMHTKHLKKSFTAFYAQILDTWYSFFSVEPSGMNIMKEKLWRNKFILIEGKPLIHG